MTWLYPFFPPTQVHICPSSLAALSAVFLSSVSSQAASFGTNFSFNLTTQSSVYYSSCFLHLVNQPAMQQAFFDILCNNVNFPPFLQAQRNERESIRQKLALGSFYDDEPVIYTSCSKNGPSSRWVWMACVLCDFVTGLISVATGGWQPKFYVLSCDSRHLRSFDVLPEFIFQVQTQPDETVPIYFKTWIWN